MSISSYREFGSTTVNCVSDRDMCCYCIWDISVEVLYFYNKQQNIYYLKRLTALLADPELYFDSVNTEVSKAKPRQIFKIIRVLTSG